MRLVYGLRAGSLSGGTVETFAAEAARQIGCDASEIVLYRMEPVPLPGERAGDAGGERGAASELRRTSGPTAHRGSDVPGLPGAPPGAPNDGVDEDAIYCAVAPGDKRLTVSKLSGSLHKHKRLFDSICSPDIYYAQRVFAEALELAERLRTMCDGLFAAQRQAAAMLASLLDQITADTLHHAGVQPQASGPGAGATASARSAQPDPGLPSLRGAGQRAASPLKTRSAPAPSQRPSDLLGQYPRSERQAVSDLLRESAPYLDRQAAARQDLVRSRARAYFEHYSDICRRLEALERRPVSQSQPEGEDFAGSCNDLLSMVPGP